MVGENTKISAIRPRVFISSVFKTLKDVRLAIHRIITEEFGWQAWWAEDYPELSTASGTLVRQVCFSGIDGSDLYLGIFPNRYGDDRLGLSFTELKYHHATSVGVPTLLYRLQDITSVDTSQRFKQEAFRFFLQDKDIGHPGLIEAINKEELYNSIRRDLHSFEEKWVLGVTQRIDPAITIRRLLMPYELDTNKQYKSFILLKGTEFDPDLVRLYLRIMDRVYEQSFHGAIEIASGLLDYMLSFQHWQDREYLGLLISLLHRWHKAGSWAGITGTLSPLNAAKAQMKARQLAEDYGNLYETARAIASCYYSEGKLDQALKWSKISARFTEDYSISGSVLLALGKINEAEQSYRRALEKHWRFGDEASYGLNLSNLGLIECKRGNKFEGLQKLYEGVALAGTSRGFRARTLRALAMGLDIAGDRDATLLTLRDAIHHARTYRLMGQLRSAERMKKRISGSCE